MTRRSRPSRTLYVALCFAVVSLPPPATAADSPSAADDPATVHARELFATGAALSKRMQWAEALSAFEEVARTRPHPVVTFNVGICERALGRYTRARATFTSFLASVEAGQKQGVGDAFVEEARDYLREIDGLLVHLRVTLKPPGARIAVDGRPLAIEKPGRLVAGVAPAGAPDPVDATAFELIVDPGAHIVQASRAGHNDIVLNRSFAPATRVDVNLELEKLPAYVRVESTVERATVLLDGRDIGLVPVDVNRPAGKYRIEVEKTGFVPYATTIVLEAGQRASLTARLVPVSHALTSKWWFWTGAVAIVAGGVAITYVVTRPTPEPPPFDGGGAGWVVVVP